MSVKRLKSLVVLGIFDPNMDTTRTTPKKKQNNPINAQDIFWPFPGNDQKHQEITANRNDKKNGHGRTIRKIQPFAVSGNYQVGHFLC